MSVTRPLPSPGDKNWGGPLNRFLEEVRESHNTVEATVDGLVPQFPAVQQAAISAEQSKLAAEAAAVTARTARDIILAPTDAQVANLATTPGTETATALSSTFAPATGITAVVTESRFGATGDGVTDDTAAIQAAVDWVAVQGGGEVIVPNGTYMIMAHVPGFTGLFLRDEGGIGLKDNVHLRMSEGATLKAIPNDARQYVIVRIFNKSNVSVSGGTIQGERYAHIGDAGGEWGYGIAISGGSNISISNVRCIECWGDGINIQEVNRPSPVPENYVGQVARNVVVSRVTCSANRRQGMSVEGVIGLAVSDSTFETTIGTAPSCGVDVEPWSNDIPTQNIVFERCRFVGNASSGLLAMKPQLDTLVIKDCVFDGNQDTEAQLKTFTSGRNITIERNTFYNTPTGPDAVRLQGGRGYRVIGNSFDAKISVRPEGAARPSNVIIAQNTVTRQVDGPLGIYLLAADRVRVQQNTIAVVGPASRGIRVDGCNDVQLRDNTVINSAIGISIGKFFADGDSSRVEVYANRLVDNGLGAVELTGVADVMFSGNSIQGACLVNNGQACVRYSGAVSGVRVLGNTFYQAPLAATGTGRAPRALDWSTYGLDTVASGNRLVPDGGSSFILWNTGSTVLTSGYMGEENGLMIAPTTARPSAPKLGTQLLDSTLSKVVTFINGVWKDQTGATV